MGNFQLLSREQEVEIAKRIEAGENEVEKEVLRSPVTLDFVIEVGERVEAGEADLRDVFEENEEPADDPDEERGPEANEKQLKKLFTAIKKLKSLRSRSRTSKKSSRTTPKPVPNPSSRSRSCRLKENIKHELARPRTLAPSSRRRLSARCAGCCRKRGNRSA